MLARLAPAAALVLFAGSGRAADPDAAGLDFFEKKIRPVLAAKCYSCHSAEAEKAKNLKAGLFLDGKAGTLKGGDSGPAVVPGDPDASLLVKAIRHDGRKMPPKEKLPDAVAADFAAWVKIGAPDPRAGTVAKREIDLDAGRKHWAYRPLANPPVPAVRSADPRLTAVDKFLLAKLEKPFGFNPPLDKERLARRAYFDLTGLPPTPEQTDAFVKDVSPDAFAKLIDALLASPRYGERWARHWLDMARFAESGGYEFDGDRPGAYHYRDFVIDALNADMPYDEFVRGQIAGDRLKPGDLAASRGDRVPRGRPVPRPDDRQDARADPLRPPRRHALHVRLGPARPVRRLRPVPRPQVRPVPHRGLLPPAGLPRPHRLDYRPDRPDAGCDLQGQGRVDNRTRPPRHRPRPLRQGGSARPGQGVVREASSRGPALDAAGSRLRRQQVAQADARRTRSPYRLRPDLPDRHHGPPPRRGGGRDPGGPGPKQSLHARRAFRHGRAARAGRR